jgi:hypothetical protein
MYKFYVHFTTIVPRYNYLERVINSWLNQSIKIQEIIISIIEPSDIFNKYKNKNNPKIKIQYLEKDYGPSTKVYGALKYFESLEDKKDVYFVICDDDHEYHKDVILSYLSSIINNPKNIYTHYLTEDLLAIKNNKIMHLQGAYTYLLNNYFLNSTSSSNYLTYLLNIFKECPYCFYVDDYLISCYISLICKIEIQTVKDIKEYNIVSTIDEMHLHPFLIIREYYTLKYLTKHLTDQKPDF